METDPDIRERFLNIKGIQVDRRLLEAWPVRRCAAFECSARCCAGGVYIDVNQAKDILAHEALIRPHLPESQRDPEKWFSWVLEPERDHPQGGTCTDTNLVENSKSPTGKQCVFLRPDARCALQVASVAAGEHPWRFKPFYCALHPLAFDDHRFVLADDNPTYLQGGSCHRPSAEPPIPLYRLFEAEVKLALGEAGYAELEAQAAAADRQRAPFASP